MTRTAALRPGRTAERWSGYLFALPYLVLFATFLLGPLIYGFFLSLHRWELLSSAPRTFVGVANYREGVMDPYVRQALGVTFKFVLFAVPLTQVLALAIAVGLNAVRGARQTFYRACYYVPTLITISVAGILWRWFYNTEFGLFNAYLAPFSVKVPWLSDPDWAMPAIILMSLWWTVGGPMVVLLAGLQGIPAHYHEAASLDGATGWQQFRHVTLPLLRPVLLFTVVMGVIGAFQVFGQMFMITRGGPELTTRTMVQFIYETAFNNYRMGYAAALSWLLFAVIAVFAVIQFRLLREER